MIKYQHIITFILYFLIIAIICQYGKRNTKSLSDYVLGQRSLNGPITALGAGASDMGGWLLLALPGALFVDGLNQIWLPIGLSIGAYLNWQFVSTRLRIYTEIANNALTIPAYLDNRYQDNSKIIRIITAIAVVIFFTFYCAAGFVSGALLFQTTFNISYTEALVISALIIMCYTALGGFIAINWIDFFQGSLMFFALIITPLVTFNHLGGLQPVLHNLVAQGTGYLQPFSQMTFIGLISLLGWGLGYFGQPHILVRFMAIRTPKALSTAKRIGMTWMVVSLLGAIATGIIGHAYFYTGLTYPESAFLKLANDLFNVWIAGILLAAVLSAVMSTSSAQLLAASSALTADFYLRFFRREARQRELILISRITVFAIAIVAAILASNPSGTILQLVQYAWGGLGASFGPVILFSLFWKRSTGKGAIAGIVTGAITVIVWKSVLSQFGGFFSLYEMIPGYILSSLAIIIVSYLDKKPSEKIINEFSEMEKLVKANRT